MFLKFKIKLRNEESKCIRYKESDIINQKLETMNKKWQKKIKNTVSDESNKLEFSFQDTIIRNRKKGQTKNKSQQLKIGKLK